MPRGGFRPGGGRPRGALNKKTLATMPTTGNMSGTEYLHRVVNDPTADPLRRDRAAAVLCGIENRRHLQPGKKAQAEADAQWAGYGGSWWNLLHPVGDSVPTSPPPLTMEPEVRARALEAQQQQWQRQQRQAKPTVSAPPTWDELLGPRLAQETPRLEDNDWGTDLDFVPQQRS